MKVKNVLVVVIGTILAYELSEAFIHPVDSWNSLSSTTKYVVVICGGVYLLSQMFLLEFWGRKLAKTEKQSIKENHHASMRQILFDSPSPGRMLLVAYSFPAWVVLSSLTGWADFASRRKMRK